MNMIAAAKDTLMMAVDKGIGEGDIESLNYKHLYSMYERMQNPSFSEAKLGRWLGWIQAACVASTCGEMTLEDCKQINMKHADV